MMKFSVRFFNEHTKETERHIIESRSVSMALRVIVEMIKGKYAKDITIIQED